MNAVDVFFSTLLPAHRRRARRAAEPRAAAATELRVCVNRSCARQGSREVLLALFALAPPEAPVSSCGCLGRCGAGPNAVAAPAGTVYGHVSSAAFAARVLADVVGPGFDPGKSLEALALRKRGDAAVDEGDAAAGESFFSQAINLNPSGGLHVLYKCRANARLLVGNFFGALSDAEEAIRTAPKYPQAYITQGDALVALGEYDAADTAYGTALHLDPALRRSKSFKARLTKLQEKFVGSSGPR